jgi:hypothetical protein
MAVAQLRMYFTPAVVAGRGRRSITPHKDG